jgi:hypothetical protein
MIKINVSRSVMIKCVIEQKYIRVLFGKEGAKYVLNIN